MPYALLSVFDKTGIAEFAKNLIDNHDYTILSSGGTHAVLEEAGIPAMKVESITCHPEMLNGRVKTLHPSVHGSILYKRTDPDHLKDKKEFGLVDLDLVVVNLYPFSQVLKSRTGTGKISKEDEDIILENIDIGGHTLLRSAMKNYKFVLPVCKPSDYSYVIDNFEELKSDVAQRETFAFMTSNYISNYDLEINKYFSHFKSESQSRIYKKIEKLKYGCNPNQKESAIHTLVGYQNPYTIVSGSPGYINMLDAVNSWGLVSELKTALGIPCAASFKHTSPAGVAIYKQVAPDAPLRHIYPSITSCNSKLAIAYSRARNCDPKSSFGDFIALSDKVDIQTARLVKGDISDGVIAPDYDPDALDILKKKKNGNFIIIKVNDHVLKTSLGQYDTEYRDIGGVTLSQQRNTSSITKDVLKKIVSKKTTLPSSAEEDLIIATITTKYTQSNSVVYAFQGQTTGIGAGQQSRIDCVQLAGRKSFNWLLRKHPNVIGLYSLFKDDLRRQERVNGINTFIELSLDQFNIVPEHTKVEKESWEKLFKEPPSLLTKFDILDATNVNGLSLSSDAFFPFRDNIDCAAIRGVSYIIHPGGSIADTEIINTCNEYGMVLLHSGLRLFHH